MGFLVFLFGAVFGSFLNVCIYRMPLSLSIVKPNSFCPGCKKPIKWFDNIPMLSYLMLSGRCRHCRKPISPRYFLVELLTAALFLFLYWQFGLDVRFFVFAPFVMALILVSFIDWDHYLIPDCIVLPGIPIGLLLNFFFPVLAGLNAWLPALRDAFIGVLVGGGFLLLLGWLGTLAFKKDAMGGGDVKLLAMIGAFLGWKSVLMTLFFGSLFGSVVSLALIAAGVKKRDEYIPFGPYLSLGAVLALFFRGGTFLGFPV
ncbi:MAG TPA: prepilin peptidase [bacterium]|uniref:Prepilin leader peptidase/N-methyltransferase n=1 Tax=candidate division TA06 bacterium ADurb.Bin417 TaxID=1852828 RepID=A0A1V5MHX2_UNCT6|nr:MAG: Type 4 prepilin-like proteins leader peptide-processing enzyme [candidate division TA06 bacterium ADurb.Bin417]HNQ35441.1 prepilin peptidase [bacterium]HNS49203.1 prepilin peptidase [bacterium]